MLLCYGFIASLYSNSIEAIAARDAPTRTSAYLSLDIAGCCRYRFRCRLSRARGTRYPQLEEWTFKGYDHPLQVFAVPPSEAASRDADYQLRRAEVDPTKPAVCAQEAGKSGRQKCSQFNLSGPPIGRRAAPTRQFPTREKDRYRRIQSTCGKSP